MDTNLPLIDNISIYGGDDTILKFTSRLGNISGYKINLQSLLCHHKQT